MPLTSWLQEGPPTLHHKHEWSEEVIAEITGTLGANIPNHAASAAGVTITVASTDPFRVGDQIYVDGVSAAYQITAITPSTTLTVTEIRAVAVSSDASNGASIRINRGIIEKSIPTDQSGHTFPDNEYNFTQIFRKDVEVSTNQQLVSQAGGFYPVSIDDSLSRASDQWLHWITYQMYRAIHEGVRIERTSSVSRGYMGGLHFWLNQVGGNLVSASGALTQANLDSAAGLIYDDVGTTDGLIMLVPTFQAKAISALLSDTAVMRHVDIFNSTNHPIGTSVASYQPNITGLSAIPIVVDQNMPASKIYILDTRKISLHPFQTETWRLEQYQTPGAKARSAFIYGEYTLKVKNAKYAHAVISGLNTS